MLGSLPSDPPVMWRIHPRGSLSSTEKWVLKGKDQLAVWNAELTWYAAGRLSRGWKWQSLDSLKLRVLLWESSPQLLSQRPGRNLNLHTSSQCPPPCQLFSPQRRKHCCLAYSPQLRCQDLVYMQGLKYWVKDQGKIKSHPAPPATCYSTLQQERPSETQGILCKEREEAQW